MITINKFKRLCYPQVNTNVNIRDFKLNCLQNKKFFEDTTAKNRKTKSVIFKDEFETELAKKFREYLKNLLLGIHDELRTVKLKEKLLNSNLPDEILELRGLCINNLYLDTSYQSSNNRQEECNIKLVRDRGKNMPSGGWRSGMLVTITIGVGEENFGSNLEAWRSVDGILVEVASIYIIIGVNSLSGWILDGYLDVGSKDKVRIMKRSEEKLYLNSIKNLKPILEYPSKIEKYAPAKSIFSKILGVDTPEEIAPVCKEQILTVYNKSLMSDQSKKMALINCARLMS